MSNLTGPIFEPQISHSRDERVTARPTGRFIPVATVYYSGSTSPLDTLLLHLYLPDSFEQSYKFRWMKSKTQQENLKNNKAPNLERIRKKSNPPSISRSRTIKMQLLSSNQSKSANNMIYIKWFCMSFS